MTEEMNRFADMLVTSQKYFKFSQAVFEVINMQPDIEHMAVYLQCAICGIEESNILKMNEAGLSIEGVCARRTELLAQMYRENDELYGTVAQANKLAKELTHKNEEIRELFEHDVKEAMQREREANELAICQAHEALNAKDTAMQILQKQYSSVLEEYENIKKDAVNYKDRVQELETELKYKQFPKPEAEVPDMQQKTEINVVDKILRKRRRAKQAEKQSYEYKMFTKNVVQNPAYTEAQKKYLIQCMADGMPYSVLKRFAAPNISIEMMEQLRRYYEDNVI